MPESEAFADALQHILNELKGEKHCNGNAQRSDVVDEHDTGDVKGALEVFCCRARTGSSVGNNLVDESCQSSQN